MNLNIIFNDAENTAQVFVNDVAVLSMNKFQDLWWTGGLMGFENPWDAARDAIASARTLNYVLNEGGDAIA